MAQIIRGIEEIFQAFNRLKTIDYSPIADAIKNNYVEQIHVVDAIDTGAFIQSVDWHERENFSQEHQQFLVDTSNNAEVVYSDIVERGRKDGANYPGRYPARKAVENADLEPIFTTSMDFVFQ